MFNERSGVLAKFELKYKYFKSYPSIKIKIAVS